MTYEIVLVPIPATPGRYAAMLDGKELCRSRQPLLDAARVLLAEGHPPETVLTTRHQGSAIVAQRSTTGQAAKWTISETDHDGLRRVLWADRQRENAAMKGRLQRQVSPNPGREAAE